MKRPSLPLAHRKGKRARGACEARVYLWRNRKVKEPEPKKPAFTQHLILLEKRLCRDSKGIVYIRALAEKGSQRLRQMLQELSVFAHNSTPRREKGKRGHVHVILAQNPPKLQSRHLQQLSILARVPGVLTTENAATPFAFEAVNPLNWHLRLEDRKCRYITDMDTGNPRPGQTGAPGLRSSSGGFAFGKVLQAPLLHSISNL